jgi:tetratricopeptide (TPR) repeat protein
MFNLFRSGLSAVAIILVFTVAACCPPCEPPNTCPGPPEATTMPPDADMDTDQGMAGMTMLSGSTKPCALVKLTVNDPVPPPLYRDIGSAHWHVPWGQDYFDQGLRFLFAFNNRESYRAFRQAAREAEDNGIPCSACYWAQALVLGVDINMPTQSEDDLPEAQAALDRAARANPNPEDQEIIRALSGRYQNCNSTPRGKCQEIRNQAYYDGMQRVLQMFGSDDPNVITLFADSAMNLAPWGYWDNLGNPVIGPITEARKYLEKALKFVQYPPNEGPIHWYIHLMEQSRTPDAAKQYADLLAPIPPWKPLAPSAGHLVHMPSHIYYRMGDMQNAIRANKEAIEADETYFAVEPNLYRPDGDRYKYGYYPHNIHFVIAAAVLSGDKDQDVNRYAEKLFQSAPDKANGMRADFYRTVYHLAKVNFSSTADIRKFAPPNPFNQQPLANIAYAFTQLMADIWDKTNFKESADKFDADVANYRKSARAKDTRGNPSCDIKPGLDLPKPELCLTAILESLGHARMAALNNNWVDAVSAATRAVDIQDAMKYDEPPWWPYPARQTLASILIRWADADPTGRGKHLTDAKDALSESLKGAPGGKPGEIPTGTFPGNGWAYYGLLEIAKQDGSSPADRDQAEVDLNAHWFGAPEFHTLDRM